MVCRVFQYNTYVGLQVEIIINHKKLFSLNTGVVNIDCIFLSSSVFSVQLGIRINSMVCVCAHKCACMCICTFIYI
jgi:hypothetical protein